jgi:uroporphyrinogen-III decarboxylase
MGHAVWQADGSDYRRPATCPFDDVEQVYAIDPVAEYGEPDRDEIARRYQAWYESVRGHDWVTPGGLYRSVVSYAIDAFGWEMLLIAAGTDPQRFGELLNRWADWLMTYVEAWAATDIEVFLTHDDMVWTAGAIFPPQFYATYVFPNYRRYWQCIRDAGKRVLFCSDGDYTAFVDDIAAAGAQGFIFEPLTDLATVCAKFGRTHAIVGNADCRVLTFGDEPAVRAEVERCMTLGRDCPGYIFAVGNHIPPNVPIANADACIDAYRQLRGR